MKRHPGQNPAIEYVRAVDRSERTCLRVVDHPTIAVECKCGGTTAQHSHERNVKGTMYAVFFCTEPDCWEEFLLVKGVMY